MTDKRQEARDKERLRRAAESPFEEFLRSSYVYSPVHYALPTELAAAYADWTGTPWSEDAVGRMVAALDDDRVLVTKINNQRVYAGLRGIGNEPHVLGPEQLRRGEFICMSEAHGRRSTWGKKGRRKGQGA